MSDQQSPENELCDPNIPAERLASLAAAHPELGADIARHPKAYDGLLDWIGQYGDADARAAVAARRAPAQAPSEPVVSPATPVVPAGAPVMPGAAPAGANPYADTQPAPKKKPKKGLTIGLIAGGLVIVLGGGGAVWAVNSIFAGKKTPEAAAEKLFTGALDLDPVALYTAMAPSEVAPLKDAFEQLKEMPTSDDKDAKDIEETVKAFMDAITVTTDGVEYRTDALMEGVSRVSIVEGELEIDADIDDLGDAMRDLMEITMRATLGQSGYYDEDEIDEMINESLDDQVDDMMSGLEDELPLTVDFADTWDEQVSNKSYDDIDEDDELIGQGYPFSVITVDEGGWYASPMLTAIDAFAGDYLIDGGHTYGDKLIEAERFRSPEDAAHGLADGVVAVAADGDFEALGAALPMAERRAISLYAPALEELDAGAEASISDFTVEVEKTNGLTGLLISDLDFLTDGEIVSTYNHPCFEDVTYGSENCIDDIPALKALGLDDALPIVIKEDGGWFVSPTATVGNVFAIATTKLAELIEDDELEQLFEF